MIDPGWVKALPIGWEAKPLRAVADYVVSNVDKVSADRETPVRLCNYTDVYNNEFITLDLDFMQATASRDEIAKFGVQVGDVLITKDSEAWNDIAVPALVRQTTTNILCGYHLALLRPRQCALSGAFLFRCLQAQSVRVQLELAANGVTRFGIPKSEIGSTKLPVPPLEQQQAITAYLDRETARLDALVAAKERLLSLLGEKRRALITRAVTRGLDPSVGLRSSAPPWLGSIPAHWRLERLKFHLKSIEQGWSPICDNSPAAPDEWGVLKAGCVNGWAFDPTENKRLPNGVEVLPQYEVREGDVLMSRANTLALLGSTAIVPKLSSRLLMCDKLYRLAVNTESLKKEYLLAFLRCPAGRHEFERDATGASNSMQNIGQDSVKNVWVPVPPIAEQCEIVEHISAESRRIESIQSATRRTIDLLKERRAALISAAVIGKITIPEVAA